MYRSHLDGSAWPAGPPPDQDASGVSVLVVDRHRLLAEAVARLLSAMDVVRTTSVATSLASAVAVVHHAWPEVVLVDDRLGERTSRDVVGQLTGGGSPPAVLFFASRREPASVVEALRAGASGWVTKDCQVPELRSALAAVSDGRRWLPHGIQGEVIDLLLEDGERQPRESPLTGLSARQREVLGCLTDGLTHSATAARLHVSPNTVRTHVRTMCHVLDVHSTPALVALARRWGLSPMTARRV